MHLDSVVILGSARTAIGGFGGSLAGLAPFELGTVTAREALARSGLEAAAIDHAVYGHIITTGPEDAYLARHIAREAGVPDEAGAFNVNRLCGSGVQALLSAAQQIALGDSRLALAGGAESMSRGAYLLPPQARSGLRMGHAAVTDLTLGILSDPFGSGHMGCTAENIAGRHGLTREAVDRFALESHHKAARAIAEGRFAEQIVPVTVRQGRQERLFDRDEHVRDGVTLEDLARLKPAFQKEGIVTAGNASGLNDGAASLVLAHADEAFAAQAMAVADALEFPAERLNPNGGAVGLGHPVGATGAILVIKALAELERTGGRYGLITLCIGGGQGIALLIERL